MMLKLQVPSRLNMTELDAGLFYNIEFARPTRSPVQDFLLENKRTLSSSKFLSEMYRLVRKFLKTYKGFIITFHLSSVVSLWQLSGFSYLLLVSMHSQQSWRYQNSFSTLFYILLTVKSSYLCRLPVFTSPCFQCPMTAVAGRWTGSVQTRRLWRCLCSGLKTTVTSWSLWTWFLLWRWSFHP